jgi:alkanesulfonate monooxygenase SsuD/methylene tetrahydromethanopterin reductase-like flavin-dependent oxidoreductase (luciferase family)
MTSEFNELLPVSPAEKPQIWIVGDRDQVAHLIDELYVRRIATDRTHFTPIVPAPFAEGKYMSVLVR